MLDWTTCQAVERDPEKLSGAWVFRGSRVPASALFENLESGATLDQFLVWFPGVTRAQTEAVNRGLTPIYATHPRVAAATGSACRPRPSVRALPRRR